jgi:carboxymethylenebutenolidase
MQDPSYLGLAAVFDGRPKIAVSTSMVHTTAGNVTVSGFLAQPAQSGRYPGIVMIHEWWGLNDQVRSMAHILAGEGYVVLAVDLFDGRVATNPSEARANTSNNPSSKTVPQLQAAVVYLRQLSAVNSERMGVIGWCYGGGQSFQLGIREELQAVVVFYGQVSADESILQGLREPVLGIFGAEDSGIPVDGVRAFESALKEMGTSVEVHIYDGAGHAFANPTSTEAFRKDQAVDAWMKTLEFLKRTLQSS